MARMNKKITILISVIVITIATTTIAAGVYDLNMKKGTITIGNKSKEIKTNKATVGELLKEQNITLENVDYVNALKERELEKEFNIVLRKAVPIALNFKGHEINLKTSEVTVEDLLKSLSIDYDEDDEVTPSIHTNITKDMKISLSEYEEKTRVVREETMFEIEIGENNNLQKGKSLLIQKGIKGLKESKIKEIYRNGKLIETQTEETKLVRKPVNEVVQDGTKIIETKVAMRIPSDLAPIKRVPVKPAPVKPAPVKPAPVKPAPVKPEPVKPAPVKPEPVKPAPVKPEPVKPEPVKPEPVKPEPVEPEPVKPEPVEPEPVKQEPVESVS